MFIMQKFGDDRQYMLDKFNRNHPESRVSHLTSYILRLSSRFRNQLLPAGNLLHVLPELLPAVGFGERRSRSRNPQELA